MSTQLSEMQTRIAEGLLHHKIEGIAELFTHDEADLQTRISVYRNNVFLSLSNALADLYPVVKQLVGEDFFLALAKRYIRQSPPDSAAMVFFGADFPDFVRQDKACLDLSYLSDVAHFELAKQHCYHAPDAESLNAKQIQEIGVGKLMSSVLVLHPSLRIVDSKRASRSIWQAHQSDEPKFDTIDIHLAEQSILIRPEYEVLICRADKPLLMLITQITDGENLASSIESTIQKYPDFNLPSALAMGFSNGFFTDIQYP